MWNVAPDVDQIDHVAIFIGGYFRIPHSAFPEPCKSSHRLFIIILGINALVQALLILDIILQYTHARSTILHTKHVVKISKTC